MTSMSLGVLMGLKFRKKNSKERIMDQFLHPNANTFVTKLILEFFNTLPNSLMVS